MKTTSELHRQWLQMVDTDGPFLAVPALTRVWPQGIPPLPEQRRADLAAGQPAFDAAWDGWDRLRHNDPEKALAAYLGPRDEWVDAVLRSVLGWGDLLSGPDSVIAAVAHAPQGVPIRPSAALVHGQLVGALVMVVDPVDDLREAADGPEADNTQDRLSPIDRMELLLRSPGSRTTIGLVTDGRWWALVSAQVLVGLSGADGQEPKGLSCTAGNARQPARE